MKESRKKKHYENQTAYSTSIPTNIETKRTEEKEQENQEEKKKTFLSILTYLSPP